MTRFRTCVCMCALRSFSCSPQILPRTPDVVLCIRYLHLTAARFLLRYLTLDLHQPHRPMDVRGFRGYLKSCSGSAEHLRSLCLICPRSGVVAVMALRYCLMLLLAKTSLPHYLHEPDNRARGR